MVEDVLICHSYPTDVPTSSSRRPSTSAPRPTAGARAARRAAPEPTPPTACTVQTPQYDLGVPEGGDYVNLAAVDGLPSVRGGPTTGPQVLISRGGAQHHSRGRAGVAIRSRRCQGPARLRPTAGSSPGPRRTGSGGLCGRRRELRVEELQESQGRPCTGVRGVKFSGSRSSSSTLSRSRPSTWWSGS